MLELQIGRFLGRLHANVQNDYFGRIRRRDAQDTEEESYSWQETFTVLLEALLWEAQSAGLDLPYEEIRSYLSRAISSFLFDDVDVPSLIWLTGSEEDVYIALPSSLLPPPSAAFSSSSSTVPTLTTAGGIAAILPNVTHAVWGDPLLETFFLPPAPSPVLKEAYTKSGGSDTLVFPRQRTKRMWYDLLLGLIVLRERDGFGASALEGEAGAQDEDRQRLIKWALDLIQNTITTLSTAPTY
ncbi:hypothetical protein CPB84DRAFT_1777945 [Gymnopilus junonius]|uniref:Uncharacterized protein n=1 Tax=Gymnopilus junonius TaxID=109634 RepID=A0A9P5TNB1_GYMJU|nr:hypothetical protein CPB84DRAFT_1777945 [Gymnopilus junonius]